MKIYLLFFILSVSILFSSCANEQPLSICNCSELDYTDNTDILEELNSLFSESGSLNFELIIDSLIIKTKWTFFVNLSDLNINKGFYKQSEDEKIYISIPTKMDSDVVFIKFGNGQVIEEDHVAFEVEESKFAKFQSLFCLLLCRNQ